ncbi:Peroxiredoxin-6-like [Frankliniella occidentalis]|uniref:1-Cys peroxiredoxin n=1 Tax=Frankliniella occidentalis TaxID=133901 RepID=A0A6J1SXW3_FRAOC|nr:peroxiredoxin-6 [Frankliniella occidentalis]XP_052125727.1 peroxiredoxin-6 [Frankliniella occidentalis]KAE8744429.1 Peroxiredoxin-6-like [Frankliniella occidentalis]
MPNLGDEFPNFKADTTVGSIYFHEWLGESWGILFSHPSDFTPVCTTELAKVLKLLPEFTARNVKVIALSCDSVSSHKLWTEDIKSFAGVEVDGFPYPIIADEGRELAVQLGMLDPLEKDANGLPLTCRAVFLVDPNKKLRMSILYPATSGRNFDEILRIIDSIQLTEKKKVATPADWKKGGDCMVLPTLSTEAAKTLFPNGFTVTKVPSGKEYIRITPQP